jgi:hypothetical protein
MQEVEYTDQDGRLTQVRKFFTGKTAEDVKGQLVRAYNEAMENIPNVIRITQRQLGRNDPCPCGLGNKFKRCCLWKLHATPPVPITAHEDDA